MDKASIQTTARIVQYNLLDVILNKFNYTVYIFYSLKTVPSFIKIKKSSHILQQYVGYYLYFSYLQFQRDVKNQRKVLRICTRLSS